MPHSCIRKTNKNVHIRGHMLTIWRELNFCQTMATFFEVNVGISLELPYLWGISLAQPLETFFPAVRRHQKLECQNRCSLNTPKMVSNGLRNICTSCSYHIPTTSLPPLTPALLLCPTPSRPLQEKPRWVSFSDVGHFPRWMGCNHSAGGFWS